MNNHYCEQTEKEVLSAALSSPDKLSLLMEFSEDIFYYAENKLIFNAIKELHEDDIVIDSSTITVKLKELRKFDKLQDHILSIYKSHSPVSIIYHLEKLNQMSRNRKMMLYLRDAYTGIKNSDISSQEFIDKIVELNEQSVSVEKEYITVKDMSGMDLDTMYNKSKFIRSVISNLDEKLYGFRNGQLIVIAGRPGTGKSTLALQCAKNIKRNVVFFSLEMDADELYLKMLSNQSNVDSNKIEHKKMNDKELERVIQSHNLLSDYDIIMYDKISTYSKIKSRIKKLKKVGKADIIFIDYLQLMVGGTGDTRDQKIGSITRGLKNLARELEIPIVLLSQLNRDLDKQNREPVLSDLRESGNIEQDTDVVIFTFEKDGKCIIIVAKNRKGKVGKIETIVFEKEFSRFRDSEINSTFENPDYFNN